MLVRMLTATAAFAIVYVAWLVFGSTANKTNNALLANPSIGNACTPGGLCLGTIVTQSFGLFLAAIVAIVIFIVASLINNAHQEEQDSGFIE